MEDLAILIIFGAFGALVLLEAVRPGRAFPRMRFWRLRGLASLGVYLVISTLSPFLWDEWLGAHRLVDATGLGTAGGAIVGFLAVELAIYVWHRALHSVPLLWRWFHQMHHAAERIDIWSAMHFTPLDVVGFAFIGSLALVWGVGVTPEAALIINVATLLLAFFQHTNIRTPGWLGYFIQRPEQHQLHHGREIHRSNYTDLVFIDMLFGTYENPDTFEGAVGFYDGASERILEMVAGRDVSTPKEPPIRAPA